MRLSDIETELMVYNDQLLNDKIVETAHEPFASISVNGKWARIIDNGDSRYVVANVAGFW